MISDLLAAHACETLGLPSSASGDVNTSTDATHSVAARVDDLAAALRAVDATMGELVNPHSDSRDGGVVHQLDTPSSHESVVMSRKEVASVRDAIEALRSELNRSRSGAHEAESALRMLHLTHLPREDWLALLSQLQLLEMELAAHKGTPAAEHRPFEQGGRVAVEPGGPGASDTASNVSTAPPVTSFEAARWQQAVLAAESQAVAVVERAEQSAADAVANAQHLEEANCRLRFDLDATRYQVGVLSQQVASLVAFVMTLHNSHQHRSSNDVAASFIADLDRTSAVHDVFRTLPLRRSSFHRSSNHADSLSENRGPKSERNFPALAELSGVAMWKPAHETDAVDLTPYTVLSVRELVDRNSELAKQLWVLANENSHSDKPVHGAVDVVVENVGEKRSREETTGLLPLPAAKRQSKSVGHHKETETDPLTELRHASHGQQNWGDIIPAVAPSAAAVDLSNMNEIVDCALAAIRSLATCQAEVVAAATATATRSPAHPTTNHAALESASRAQLVVRRSVSALVDIASTVEAQSRMIESLLSENASLMRESLACETAINTLSLMHQDLMQIVQQTQETVVRLSAVHSEGTVKEAMLSKSIENLHRVCNGVLTREAALESVLKRGHEATTDQQHLSSRRRSTAMAQEADAARKRLESDMAALADQLRKERTQSVGMLEDMWRLEEEASAAREELRLVRSADMVPRSELAAAEQRCVDVVTQLEALREELRESRQAMADADRAMGTLQRQNDEGVAQLNRRIHGLEDSLRFERDTVRRLRGEVEQALGIEQRARQRCEHANEEAAAAKQAMRSVEEELANAHKSIDALRVTILHAAFPPASELLTTDVDDLLNRRLRVLRDDHAQISARLAKFEVEFPAAVTEIEQLRVAKQSSDALIQSLRVSLMESTQHYQRLQDEHESTQRATEEQRRSLEAKNTLLEKQLVTSNLVEHELRAKLASLRDDRTVAIIRRFGISTVNSFTETVERLERELKDLRQQELSARQELSESRSAYAVLQTENAAVVRNSTNLSQELDGVTRNLERVSSAKAEADVTIARLNQLNDQQSTELASLKSDLQQSQIKVVSLQENIAQVEAEKMRLTRDNTTLRTAMLQTGNAVAVPRRTERSSADPSRRIAADIQTQQQQPLPNLMSVLKTAAK